MFDVQVQVKNVKGAVQMTPKGVKVCRGGVNQAVSYARDSITRTCDLNPMVTPGVSSV